MPNVSCRLAICMLLYITMKKFQAASLIALLAILPSQFASAGEVSEPVKQNVQQVKVSPKDAQAMASLVTALKDEIKAQGLDKMSDIAATVIASASDADSARALAEALTTAAILVSAETGSDLAELITSVGEGLATASEGLQASIVEGATAAVTDNVSAEQVESITQTVTTAVTTTPTGGDTGSTGGTQQTGGTETAQDGEQEDTTQPGGEETGGDTEIIVPDTGDAGDTPSVDISTGTGVGD